MFQPFRNSALGPAEPKTIYGAGELGQKFVDPTPGQPTEEIVSTISIDHFTNNYCFNSPSEPQLW